MKREIIGAQGEITFFNFTGDLPEGLVPMTELDTKGRPIISHSEKGHHHVLSNAVTVLEATKNVPEGMRILYAILDNPTKLIQDAPDAHGAHTLDAGCVEFRIAREFDPFADQARMVRD